MTPFQERVDADRRLCILRILIENGGAASESVVERALLELGERTGMDRSVSNRMLRELEEKTCVRIDLYRDKLMVAEITKFGVAVAEGRQRIEGVSKPSLGV